MGMFDSLEGQLSPLWGGDPHSVDNSKAYYNYANALRQRMGVYDPIVNMGNDARNLSWEQYQRLINDPNSVQNQVAGGFSMSPYQKQLEDDVTQSMNYNAANTGMLNSGAAQAALQDRLTNMTGQFENQYIDRGMNSYYQGLTGANTLSNLGFDAMGRQDQMFDEAAGADLYGKMSKNQYKADTGFNFGNYIKTGLGVGMGAMTGMPMGGMGGAGGTSMFPSMYNSGNWSY